MSNDFWKHKDEWKHRGTNFIVSITRHEEDYTSCGDGPHRWCVYAYIYPKHPHFKNFSGDSLFQEACDMPFHGGCTFLEYPMYNGEVTSVKVGCDYNHLYDEYFTHIKTQEEAYEVFSDAKFLYDWLEERSTLKEKTMKTENLNEPNQITFNAKSENDYDWVMRITADRKIEVNDDVEVTDAAKAVFKILQSYLDNPSLALE